MTSVSDDLSPLTDLSDPWIADSAVAQQLKNVAIGDIDC